MKNAVGAYEAKTKLPELLRRVQAGERFTITSRGTPVAELTPPMPARASAVANMRGFKRISGVSAAQVRALISAGRR